MALITRICTQLFIIVISAMDFQVLTFVVIMSLIVTGSNLEKSHQVAAQNELDDCCEKKSRIPVGVGEVLCVSVCVYASVCLPIYLREGPE